LKRTLEPLVLSKTPLIFVLAQIRVAPIAQIEACLPDIQEVLRHKGFPGLVKRKFRIQNPASEGPDSTEDRIQWEFINNARTRSVLIDDGSLVLQSTDYESGEEFLDALGAALQTFGEIAEPTDLVRIGLRYVDLIKPIGGQGLDALVAPALRPEAQALPGASIFHLWESLRQTSENTRLRVRYTEAAQGFAFPQDLGPILSLKLRHPPMQQDPFGLLDCDHFDERASSFDIADILERTGALHDVIDQSFRSLVTPEALTLWK